MSYRGKVKRYLLILERLHRPANFSELESLLEEEGFHLSQRTLQRDLADLRDEFGIEVPYDHSTKTYAVEDQTDLQDVMPLLQRAQLLELVRDGKTLKELRQYVRFEELGRLQGIHHLGSLLQAIRARHEVKITHRKFQGDRSKEHLIRPHQLKEYRGRWYVLGRSTKHAGPIALGLDRIEKLEATRTKFTRNNDAVADFYETVIGVDTSPGKPELIRLRFNPVQARYVKALPIHHSQQVESEDKDGVVFSVYVMANTELRQMLMGWGDLVQVLEPKYLAKEIRDAHRNAAKQYGKSNDSPLRHTLA
ncbi:MAG: WYL domain-containing protein [Flavobacteriales bacterium]|nr:WYL domain-containing protein [Flavobacteriales bacterium]MBK9599423.1 WYL domain-containing protein [Flavobacteriales bacterium]